MVYKKIYGFILKLILYIKNKKNRENPVFLTNQTTKQLLIKLKKL